MNSWIDLPVVTAIEYFTGIIATALVWAQKYGSIFGFLGIVWCAFKVMLSRMTVKDFWWSTLFKFAGFIILLNFYPTITYGFSQIAHEIAINAGGGKDSIVTGLQNLRSSIKRDIQNQEKIANGITTEINSSVDGLVMPEMKNGESYRKYMNKVNKKLNTHPFNSTEDRKKAAEIVQRHKKKRKSDGLMFSAQTLNAIDKVLVTKNSDGSKNADGTSSFVTLNIFLKAGEETTPYISPSALLRIALLSCQIMFEKENTRFSKEMDEIDEESVANGKLLFIDTSKIASLPDKIGAFADHFWRMLMCFLCCIVLLLSTIFAAIQYVMTIIEYAIISGIGAIFIPLILFDGTKDIPKKLVPVFTNFMVKIIVITICILFVYYLIIQQTMDSIADDAGMNWTVVGEIFFQAILCFILTQNAPQIASTIMTGQPRLSMGEALQGAGTAIATAATIKQAPGAGFKGIARTNNVKNDVMGGIAKSNAASSSAKEALGEDATPFQRFKAGAAARHAVASQGLKDRMHAKFESAGKSSGTGFSVLDKGLQMAGFTGSSSGYGGAGGGAGGSATAYGRSGQYRDNQGGIHSISNVSNPHFKNAQKLDEKTGQLRNMTKREFIDEKKAQGTDIGKEIAEQMKKKMENKNSSQ